MVWNPRTSCGFESLKIRFDALPYLRSGVDIGCGGAKVWPHLLGVDNGRDQQLFGTPMKPDIVVPTCERMTIFADGAFESVFSSHTLEHIENYRAALAEWWRILRVGGHLVLYLPHRDFYPNIGQPGANPDHKHDFVPQDIIAALREIAPDWTLMENQARDAGDEYSFWQVFRKEAAGHGQAEVWDASRPPRTAGIVRVGGHGDALWASSPIALLKEQGYHVTAYVARTGAQILAHDPHIDRLIELPDGVLTDDELLAYFAHEAAKYDHWTNLIGSVEGRLLPHVNERQFYLSHELRHRFSNTNYLEIVHDYAGLPHDFRQKYHPTADELATARELRDILTRRAPGPVVVINPSGSGPVKYWPHSQRLMELLAAAGVYSVVLGDLQDDGVVGVEPWGVVVGMEFPVRIALAYAQLADAVVATESLIANAVAFEPMLKVVTLSHSSRENLTKHWVNTASIEPVALKCHPCHRIHPPHFGFCAQDTLTRAAACQAMARPEPIAEVLISYLRQTGRLSGLPLDAPADAAPVSPASQGMQPAAA